MKALIIILCLSKSVLAVSSVESKSNGLKVLKKIFEQCTSKAEVFKCFKIQAIKVADKAVQAKNINIMDGVKFSENKARTGRMLHFPINVNESHLEKLPENKLDNLLIDTTGRFFQSHQLEISVPRLVEEGRKKDNEKGGYGALWWALAIKGSFLAMAYNGIAVMAGSALIIGKMALLLSAILGLKKLVSSGHESTTVEIIKQPKHTESHSTSYEDEGHYGYKRMAWDDDDAVVHRRVYRTYIPLN